MAIQLNHTIVHVPDPAEAGRFFAEVMGLPEPRPFGPFLVVECANGVSLDLMAHDGEIWMEHYAFLVSDEEWDATFGRIQAKGLDYWAGPHLDEPGEINHHDGGRGVYWKEPSGHLLEIITVPYGGWPAEG